MAFHIWKIWLNDTKKHSEYIKSDDNEIKKIIEKKEN